MGAERGWRHAGQEGFVMCMAFSLVGDDAGLGWPSTVNARRRVRRELIGVQVGCDISRLRRMIICDITEYMACTACTTGTAVEYKGVCIDEAVQLFL